MAVSPSPGLGGGNKGRGRYRPLAEINVTPLVDVMLVLLIVFMVAAPLMTSGVTVDLPKTDAAPINQDAEPLTVSLDAQGRILIRREDGTLEPYAVGDIEHLRPVNGSYGDFQQAH